MRTKSIRVLDLRPESLAAEPLELVLPQDTDHLTRLIVVTSHTSSEHGEDASVALANALKSGAQLLESRCVPDTGGIEACLFFVAR